MFFLLFCVSLDYQEDDDVTSFVVSPDDQYLVVATKNILLKQWTWQDGEHLLRTWKVY